MAIPAIELASAPSALLDWFSRHRRDLPWRTPIGTARNPWMTLVSEIMSQQTRLEVVVPRFEDWMALFPTPSALAQASEEQVLSAWAGLGYYSRARNLRRTAIFVTENGWPRNSRELVDLPGIGPYTAAALASLVFGEQVAMVDGNVIRVLSRLIALEIDPRSGAGAAQIRFAARQWIRGTVAGETNEATMELGALVCTPRNPDCTACPLSEHCRAAFLGEPERFPVPEVRREKVLVHRNVVVAEDEDGIVLRRATSDELLAGLWILPGRDDHPSLEASEEILGEIRHSITRNEVRWTVSRGLWTGGSLPDGWARCSRQDLSQRMVSSLPRKALALAGIRIG